MTVISLHVRMITKLTFPENACRTKNKKKCFDKQEKPFPVMFDYPNLQKCCVY